MKINTVLANILLLGLLGLQAWTLTSVVDLKIKVAELNEKVAAITNNKNSSNVANK